MRRKRQRLVSAFVILAILIGVSLYQQWQQHAAKLPAPQSTQITSSPALSALASLAIKGRAPMTGYDRSKFGGEWGPAGDCDMRNFILARDMTNVRTRSAADCTVLSGTLDDPYTGKIIQFMRGAGTSQAVQIDHVVALGDAWQTGAQQLPQATREQLYNDPLELLAVDGPSNEQKGDGDAATWLPPNKGYRCRYIARQIAVKAKYRLWVTSAEHDAMQRILAACPGQQLPVVK